MSSSTYDILKNLCTKWLPGLGTLYFALCQIWNLPYGEEVLGTITAICTFIGVCIGISSKMYYSPDEIDYDGHGDCNKTGEEE